MGIWTCCEDAGVLIDVIRFRLIQMFCRRYRETNISSYQSVRDVLNKCKSYMYSSLTSTNITERSSHSVIQGIGCAGYTHRLISRLLSVSMYSVCFMVNFSLLASTTHHTHRKHKFRWISIFEFSREWCYIHSNWILFLIGSLFFIQCIFRLSSLQCSIFVGFSLVSSFSFSLSFSTA